MKKIKPAKKTTKPAKVTPKPKTTKSGPWNKGGHLPEEMKRKISDALKGNVPWNKGKKTGVEPWNKGKKTAKTKKRVKPAKKNASKGGA